jgi:hypothetical protein
VRRPRGQGVSLAGPDRRLKRLTKTAAETALGRERPGAQVGAPVTGAFLPVVGVRRSAPLNPGAWNLPAADWTDCSRSGS